jgi:ubiquinone biosynthesis protein
MQPTSDRAGVARRALRAAGAATDLVARAAAHIAALAADAESDAQRVAAESQALWALVTARAADLAGLARATPRVGRIAAEGLRILARHRLDTTLDPEGAARATARRVRELCVELRGGVLKIGQLASSRIDLLPPAAIEELAQLQDRVPPVADELIRAHVAAELGRPLEEVFQSFGPPLAAASLAQVHEAVLKDGTEVAVKVLVPGIEAVVESDLQALRLIAAACADALPGADLATVAAELGRSIRAELDCRAEAAELEAFAARLASDPRIVVPRPLLATRRVLVMERLRGDRLADFLAGAAADERDRVIVTLVDCFAAQILEHGAFHADPHPGNFLVLAGARVGILDFGCVMALPDGARRGYGQLLVAVLARDAARAAALFGELGFQSRSGDPAALHDLAELMLGAMRDGADLATMDPRRQLERALAVLADNPVARVPEHFVLVGRVLAALGGLVFAYPPRAGLFAILLPRLTAALPTR